MNAVFNEGENSSLEYRLKSIKKGDLLERDDFIKDYIPFIIKATSKVINTYVDLNNSEEYSMALIAFNEAIDSYDKSKGSFLNYANLVIKNRIIDFLRKNNRRKSKVIPLYEVTDTVDEKNFTDQIELEDEIEEFKDKLGNFNITLEELVEQSPKHIAGRIRSVKMARFVINKEDLKINFYRLKRLPMKVLSESFKITIKTLKRTKKFTTATVLILDGNFSLLKSRIIQVERRN